MGGLRGRHGGGDGRTRWPADRLHLGQREGDPRLEGRHPRREFDDRRPVLALVSSLLLLIPGQSALAFGIELAVALVPVTALQLRSLFAAAADRRTGSSGVTVGVLVSIAGLAALQFIPFVVAVVLLVLGVTSGLLALAAGVILVIVAPMVTAWALLVEVLR
jgi:hypothetical protein